MKPTHPDVLLLCTGLLRVLFWLTAAVICARASLIIDGLDRKARDAVRILTAGLACTACLSCFFAFANSGFHMPGFDVASYLSTVSGALTAGGAVLVTVRAAEYARGKRWLPWQS